MDARKDITGRQGFEMLDAAGYGAGENNSQAIITPVMAVGTSAGVIYLISVSTLQVYLPLNCRIMLRTTSFLLSA